MPWRGSQVAKKKINAKEVLSDIKSGMRDNALMGKYHLSPGQLASLMEKLRSAGLLDRPEPEEPAPVEEARIDYSFFSCPACGFGEGGQFDECPRCGVVVSKYEPPPQPAAALPVPGAEKKPVIEVWPEQTRRNLRGIKIIVVLALILAVVVALVLVDKRGKDAQSTDPQPVEESVSQEEMSEEDRLNSLSEGKPPKYRKKIDERLPHVKPINPELDAHMNKSFGDVGDSLDEKTRAGEDLTNQP